MKNKSNDSKYGVKKIEVERQRKKQKEKKENESKYKYVKIMGEKEWKYGGRNEKNKLKMLREEG